MKEKSYEVPIRYGLMPIINNFRTNILDLKIKELCIIKTDRGIEHGVVIGKPVETQENKKNYPYKVLRKATNQDLQTIRNIKEITQKKEKFFCQEKIKEYKLPMKLVAVEHLFGGNKIIFYFYSEGRVDFRALVKDLATEFRTRIELRQIGVRDEARIVSDIGHCGRTICCKQFLTTLDPVTMKMAKLQKDTLDPTKISGVCGRLMCCLRYEFPLYEELKKGLPNIGDVIETTQGTGEVISCNILAQKINVKLQDERIIEITPQQILRKIKEVKETYYDEMGLEDDTSEDMRDY